MAISQVGVIHEFLLTFQIFHKSKSLKHMDEMRMQCRIFNYYFIYMLLTHNNYVYYDKNTTYVYGLFNSTYAIYQIILPCVLGISEICYIEGSNTVLFFQPVVDNYKTIVQTILYSV